MSRLPRPSRVTTRSLKAKARAKRKLLAEAQLRRLEAKPLVEVAIVLATAEVLVQMLKAARVAVEPEDLAEVLTNVRSKKLALQTPVIIKVLVPSSLVPRR